MNESPDIMMVLTLLLGGLIVVTLLLRRWVRRVHVPCMVVFLLLGFLLRFTNTRWEFLSTRAFDIFEFLGTIGLVCLLFRVGLESNLQGLIRQLPHASIIGVSAIITSGGGGFLASYYLLNLSFITSLFVAIALTATSVGISIAVWAETDSLNSPNGQLLLDIAEMDDITAIVLMALLFAVAPALKGGVEGSLPAVILYPLGIMVLKLLLFGSLCLLFSRYAEKTVTDYVRKISHKPAPLLFVLGMSLIIAGIAGVIGFSAAIGAFFAGLVFSRDPEKIKLDASFENLYELFTPFFFIFIGLNIDPSVLVAGISSGILLLGVAIAGKFVGGWLGGGFLQGTISAALIGVSLVPRAEIAMVVMHKGKQMGDWAVPGRVFSGVAFAVALTSIIAPIVLRRLLNKFPQNGNA